MAVFAQAGAYLVSTFGGLIIFALAMRFFIHFSRVSWSNPVVDSLNQCVDPWIKRAQRLVSTRFEFALLLIMVAIQLVKLTVLYVLGVGGVPSVVALVAMALVDSARLLANICFYALLAEAVLSWIPGMQQSALYGVLSVVTTPILSPIRRHIPCQLNGIDFAPLLAIIGLQLLDIIVFNPLMGYVFAFMS